MIIKSIQFFLCLYISSLTLLNQAFANDPWLLEQGQRSYGLSFVSESFEKKWLGTEKSAIPEISQQTVWLSLNMGVTDRLQLGLQTGQTQSDFDGSNVEFDGLADTRINVKYSLYSEYAENPLTLALLVGTIFKGSYERSYAGNPHSPGDKANGIEFSLPLAKSLDRYTFIADLGYRYRSNDVPDDIFLNFAVGVSLLQNLYLQTRLSIVDARNGLTIGEAPFTPDDFHRVEEDKRSIEFLAGWAFKNGLSLYSGLAEVLDGKNSGDSSVFYFGLQFKH